MQFQQRLAVEFARRRERNPRYSLRAFARDLGTDHATLSQIMRHRRPLSARMAGELGRRLGLGRADLTATGLQQNAGKIARLISARDFQPNTRWIAIRTGIPMDEVNAAITQLLSARVLTMKSARRWAMQQNPYA